MADLPVLWATLVRLDLPATLDRHYPAPPHWKRRPGAEALAEAAAAAVRREGVEGLPRYEVRAREVARAKRAYAGRPARQEVEVLAEVEVSRDEESIGHGKREMGWQVYAPNGPPSGLAAVVWAYRGQYRVEDDWARLKGRPLGLTPLYLQDEGRIQGLVYLLSLAPRVLTLLEWVARERLREGGVPLRGAYPGQPGRKTMRPGAELLLGALAAISASAVEVGGQTFVLLTPLTEVHGRILRLLDLPPDLYENVIRRFPIPPPSTSER